MAHLYHRIPHNIEGDVLYPLNQLRGRHPEVYREAASKYEGREDLMARQIPLLDCLWNDVLQFSPVNPEHVKRIFVEQDTRFHANRYFRIDADQLPASDTVVYLYKPEFDQDKLNPGNWERFDPAKVDSYSSLPAETIEYLSRKLQAGERPLLWVNVPHILYRGTLDISSLEVVEI